MKKIISLFIAVMMIAAMSISAFAATMSFDAPEVEIGATSATVNLEIAFDVDASIGMLQVNFLLPAGITLTDADFSEFTALCEKITNDNAFEIGQLLIYDDDMDVAVTAGSKINIAFTFAIADSSTASVYDIKLDDGNTMVINPDGNPLVDAFPATTITVKEAAFTPETVKGAIVEGDDTAIELPKSEGSANTHTYTNVATFKATLGADVKYGEAGFIWVKDDVETANKFAVDASVFAGGGTFEYGVVMAGIPAGVNIDAVPYYVTAE